MICFYQNNLTTKWVDITHYPARTPSSLPTAVYWFQLKFFPKPWQLITAWWVWLKYRNYNLTIWAEISLSTPFLPPEWWSSLLLCPSWSPLLSRAHRMGQLSLFRRIFCAHKLFGTELCGEEDGRLCSDIYRTSGRTDWPDGRNSLPSAANFLFFTAFHQDVNSLPWTISNLQLRFVSSVVSSALLTTLFVVQHWEEHGFDCTL